MVALHVHFQFFTFAQELRDFNLISKLGGWDM
jgi:hypothetical protein